MDDGPRYGRELFPFYLLCHQKFRRPRLFISCRKGRSIHFFSTQNTHGVEGRNSPRDPLPCLLYTGSLSGSLRNTSPLARLWGASFDAHPVSWPLLSLRRHLSMGTHKLSHDWWHTDSSFMDSDPFLGRFSHSPVSRTLSMFHLYHGREWLVWSLCYYVSCYPTHYPLLIWIWLVTRPGRII